MHPIERDVGSAWRYISLSNQHNVSKRQSLIQKSQSMTLPSYWWRSDQGFHEASWEPRISLVSSTLRFFITFLNNTHDGVELETMVMRINNK